MTVLAAIALVQCYATRTQDGCAPLSYHDTMAECRALAGDYRRVDTKALTRAGIPAIVSYRDQDNHPLLPEAPWFRWLEFRDMLPLRNEGGAIWVGRPS